MVKTLLLLLLLHAPVVQKDYPVKKIWLFSRREYNGNVARQPDGQPGKGYREKMLCYIEVLDDKTMPEWHTAVVNGQKYKAEAMPVNQDSVVVGVIKKTNSEVIIRAGTGDKLVQLILSDPVKLGQQGKADVRLSGTRNGKTEYAHSNQPVVELTDEMMP